MADITMCRTLTCPAAKDCERAQATPSPYQSMAMFNPNDCDMFIPVKDKDKQHLKSEVPNG